MTALTTMPGYLVVGRLAGVLETDPGLLFERLPPLSVAAVSASHARDLLDNVDEPNERHHPTAVEVD